MEDAASMIWPRRRVLLAISAMGVGSALFGRALTALAAGKSEVTVGMIREAEWVAGLQFTPADRKLMLDGVNETLRGYQKLRSVLLDNSVPPALRFDPAPWAETGPLPGGDAVSGAVPAAASSTAPASDDDLAYATVAELAGWLRSRRISSVDLTRLYLERMKKHDPQLKCIVNYTEEMAMRQAEAADREIAAGLYRGPLHGVPWGAKDLLAVAGYPTTWGSPLYKDQARAETSTVVSRLEQAGAVLLAKLSVGELAWGDVWFGGTTKNPWNLEQGSSGSSAGSASAAAAGLLGFAIGTETWGSIVSPCTRCGVTGLRPTFGRVSRHGAMALSWSMDKVGPIARSVEDCALVFQAIQGRDLQDPVTVGRPFDWPPRLDLRALKIGYVESLFEKDRAESAGQDAGEEQRANLREWGEFDKRALQTLRDLGLNLVPIKLPESYPVGPLAVILGAEAATAFDELTRSGRDDQMVRQVEDAWPNEFRQGQMIPAVEYLRANRIRTLLMRELEKVMSGVDLYVAPSYGGDNLLMTNLTGHPAVVVPNGFRTSDGTPTSITFTGRLFGETDLLAVALAYQQATDFHKRRPPLAA